MYASSHFYFLQYTCHMAGFNHMIYGRHGGGIEWPAFFKQTHILSPSQLGLLLEWTIPLELNYLSNCLFPYDCPVISLSNGPLWDRPPNCTWDTSQHFTSLLSNTSPSFYGALGSFCQYNLPCAWSRPTNLPSRLDANFQLYSRLSQRHLCRARIVFK